MIDDGPHNPETQSACVRMYAPLMAPGGWIVIEDIIQDSWVDAIRAQVPAGFIVEIYDNRKNRCLDDMLMIIRRPL